MARKVNSGGGNFEYYTGVAALAVHRFNPSNEQYQKVVGREAGYDLKYEETKTGQFPVKVLMEIKSTNEEGLGVGKFVTGTIYVKKEFVQNTDKTKTLYVNGKGQYSYLADDYATNFPENMKWFDTKILRKAYVGEKDLASLIQRMVAFSANPSKDGSTPADDWAPYDQLLVDFFKKYDVTKLNKLLGQVPDGLDIPYGACGITGLLTVTVTDEGKKYQQVLLREDFIHSTGINDEMEIRVGYKAVENIAKALEEKAKQGYPLKDQHSLSFQVFEGQPTLVKPKSAPKVEEDGDDLPF